MSTLFISYRRTDSEHFSARLHEALENALGIGEAFLDKENLEGSDLWKTRLKEEIESSVLFIAVIGAQWLKEIEKRKAQDDQVVWEIKTAIELGKPIIPLLISQASMPEATDLPESICTLPSHNAITLASSCVEDLQKVLQQILTILSRTQPLRNGDNAKNLRRFLDPTLDLFKRYEQQPRIIKVGDEAGSEFRVPAVALLNARDIPDEKAVEVEFRDDIFEAHAGSREALAEYTRDAIHRGKSFYDDETARLADVRVGEHITLVFQPTSYFESVKTNMSMDFDDGINGSLRDEFHPRGQLEPLASSQLANHLGINGLVFSNDGHMIFQRRNARVFTNPNQLCPGFSGAIKLADIKSRRSSIDNLADMDVYRELIEELGIKERFITERRFMGLSRELQRGGKPEIFFAIAIDMSATEIRECGKKDKEGDIFSLPLRSAKVTLTEEEAITMRSRFEKIVQKMEGDAGARASMPLLTNLAFWVNQHEPPLMFGH